MSGLTGTMANGRDASKHLHHGESACPYAASANLRRFASAQLTIKATIWRAGLGLRESDSGLFLN
jgi:hypothetical protein